MQSHDKPSPVPPRIQQLRFSLAAPGIFFCCGILFCLLSSFSGQHYTIAGSILSAAFIRRFFCCKKPINTDVYGLSSCRSSGRLRSPSRARTYNPSVDSRMPYLSCPFRTALRPQVPEYHPHSLHFTLAINENNIVKKRLPCYGLLIGFFRQLRNFCFVTVRHTI